MSDIDKRFDNIDTQLEKISVAVVKGFDRIDKVLETKANNTDIQKIYTLLDSLSKRLEISEDERLVMGHQLTRLHEWVEAAAERIDLKFVH